MLFLASSSLSTWSSSFPVSYIIFCISILIFLFSYLRYSTSLTVNAISLSLSFSSFNLNNCYYRFYLSPFLLICSRSFKYCISFCSFYTSASSYALISFLDIFIVTHLVLSANLSVERVSSTNSKWGLTVAIKQVRVLPPKESWSNLVSLESLKGIWVVFF